MNAVEIEQAVTELSEQPFDPDAFPYDFLTAFGNKATTIKRLQTGSTNQSDVGGILQRGNIHILVSEKGGVGNALKLLRSSPKNESAKAKFILATDGITIEAEELANGEIIACDYADFPNHFGFFLPLAGISTVKQIRESSFDIRATSRLNKLYVELLKDNPDWATDLRRPDMNHFMARLIFCFFAEDTDIIHSSYGFTHTVETMSERDSGNTHEVIGEIFRAMDTKIADREKAGIRNWANPFPYVNGQLFSGSTQAPRFSKIARSYLIHIGNLDWKKINPDIFGSMIQAVADDEERGALGMHYTSVPNILKVLNPLFLDDLREQLTAAGDNDRKLLNLRKRMAKIRIFDPACGSGNFLVIAYKEMRGIEAVINQRRGEAERRSDIPLTNYRGIELRDFPAEIARLALIIAEYQCDVTYRGQQEALAEFLPLDSENWITCGNALRLDWLNICPPTGTGVKMTSDDLFNTPLNQSEINFENELGETYLCGNPPYIGRRNQNKLQKSEIKHVFSGVIKSFASLDYVFCWIELAAKYCSISKGSFAFVTTNSVSQGSQVSIFWKNLFSYGLSINFAVRTFQWSNNASNNAGVSCVIVGIGPPKIEKTIFDNNSSIKASNINPYLMDSNIIAVNPSGKSISTLEKVQYGNLPGDGNNLTIDKNFIANISNSNLAHKIVRKMVGAQEMIKGLQRKCLWIDDIDLQEAKDDMNVAERIQATKDLRISSKDPSYNKLAIRPHQFRDRNVATYSTIIIPIVSSENRKFLPVGFFEGGIITNNSVCAIYDGDIFNIAILSSRIHLVWIATVCGKLETRYRYSNTLGWNTFPLPKLTEQNKADLTRCAENILLAREAHYPATIADLYDPEKMPDDLRRAHDANDEVLERIYIGRRFKNDTERLEKLFELYTKMTAGKVGEKAA